MILFSIKKKRHLNIQNTSKNQLFHNNSEKRNGCLMNVIRKYYNIVCYNM